MMRRPALLVVVSLAAFASACGSSSDGGGGDTTGTGSQSGTFLAFGDAFQGFGSWESFKVPADVPGAGIHTTGARTEYLNHRPPHGSTSFPVGTIIVKEFAATAAPGQIFAMVKRGGEYNAAGAAGWEWFELQNDAQGATSIVWRGVGPPSGEKYGGDPSGGCNSCHGISQGNDFVRSDGLRLTSL